MNNRVFVMLLTSAVLALPAFAQQTNSNSSTPPAVSADQTAPASQPATATGKEPLKPRAHQDFWDGDEPGLGWLVLHPFASKKYVQREVQTIQERINELDDLTASNSKMIKDSDARAQQGIQLASEKTKLGDEHAQEALNKAQMAHQTETALDTRASTVETSVGNIDQYKSAPLTEIRFHAGQTVLSKQAKNALDEIATQLKNQHGYIIEVRGFSSGRGQAAIANSRKMADSVVRYLVSNHEIPAYRIYVIGMGNARVTNQAADARVEISLLRNDLKQNVR
jgi:outer membrane protein OmpA-like peptidoglycan-associated protein